jgi:hypothetical protein
MRWPEDSDPKWKPKDDEVVFVVCSGCKRIYSAEVRELISLQTLQGVGPGNPDAPARSDRAVT